MSTISAGTTVGTALVQSGDTTGNLVIKTGSSATTALTISGTDQSITVAGGLNLGAPVAIASGGTGQTTRQNAMDALAGSVTNGLYLRGDGADVVMGTLRAGDMTGTLVVANGGTGQTTLSSNHVLLGNGTSGVQAVAPGSNGNVLTSNGTTWTSSAPSGGVTSFNTRTGAVTLSTTDVLTALAGATSGTVGVSVFAGYGAGTLLYNDTVSGSSLRQIRSNGAGVSTSFPGTYRFLGSSAAGTSICCSSFVTGLYLRIS
jgi:hypothetical protein